jgi:hypothetical protein
MKEVRIEQRRVVLFSSSSSSSSSSLVSSASTQIGNHEVRGAEERQDHGVVQVLERRRT